MEQQQRTQSKTWWLGMLSAVAEAVCGVLTASGYIPAEVGASVIAGLAIILGYCNGNNPSVKGQY
ncbi:hypothetical protein LJC56_10155 [Christensenellaceae bacterium OttesenSCG-928-K19]|nr:hypothetical protein [Christensenellaceae bacterium OttesenSCG-928-K19]